MAKKTESAREVMTPPAVFRCGTVAIVGRPNVGKSTLINAVVGEKLSIVTPRPGTTRDKILGILTRKDAQILFLDTPGFGKAPTLLDKRLLETARNAWDEADIILWVLDASRGITPEDRRLSQLFPKKSFLLILLNKIDRVAKPKLLPQMQELSQLHPDIQVIPISATTGDGLPFILETIVHHLPEGKAHFPDDEWTDRPTRFLASELIREQILLAVHDELPHAVAVQIEEWSRRKRRTTRRVRGHQRRGPSQPITYIRACIWVERPTQKAIVVGAKGAFLKAAGSAARQKIEQLLGENVYLDLWVKVKEDWRNDPRACQNPSG